MFYLFFLKQKFYPYNTAVVAAKSEEDVRSLEPPSTNWEIGWKDPNLVEIKKIGETEFYKEREIISYI